eukprot:3543532-Pleurochrysis_carterae.AAC.1
MATRTIARTRDRRARTFQTTRRRISFLVTTRASRIHWTTAAHSWSNSSTQRRAGRCFATKLTLYSQKTARTRTSTQRRPSLNVNAGTRTSWPPWNTNSH